MYVLFICVFLWEKEHTHSMRWHTNNTLGRFFSHRVHRVNRAFLCTVSSPQNASGIQSSQSVTAKEGCWVIVVRCWWLAIGVSRWLRPSLLGRGRGRGLFLTWVSRWSRPSLWGRGRGRGLWPTEGLRHTENTERFSFRWVWCMWERRVYVVIKNPYSPPSWPPSQHAYIIAYNRGYNPQEISVLRFTFEYMPFLLVEDALLDARKACSWT